MNDAQIDIFTKNTKKLNGTLTKDDDLTINIQSPKTLDASFNTENDISLSVSLQSSPYIDAEFGVVYQIEGDNRVLYATTKTWDSMPSLVSRAGFIYIYSDWRINEYGQKLVGIKIGDGNAYLIDMPFAEEEWVDHINDKIIHITQEEREFWNNKVRCYMSEDNTNLIFTTN